jgi:hypothetical protein
MRERPGSKLVGVLPRIPVALLGLAIAASAVEAACVEMVDSGGGTDQANPVVDTRDAGAPDASEDSPDDRADGMSYGDGYGADTCVSSTVTYPPAPGCPAGDHTWTCWKPTSATSVIPESQYSILPLCGDVVVIDRSTHLMWAQDEETTPTTWAEAAAACNGSRRAGFSDWRLPSSNELMSLVDYASDMQILDPNVFKGATFPDATMRPWLWSSTPVATSPGNAWVLNGSGGIYPAPTTEELYVRCVR